MSNLILIGMMGSGKSFWGKKLAAELGYGFLDTDDTLAQRAGKTVTEIFQQQGETAFRQMESQLLQDWAGLSGQVISTGGGLPCFGSNMNLLLKMGWVVWLNPPVEVMANRIWLTRNKRPLIAAMPSEAAVVEKLLDLLEMRYTYYGMAHRTVDEVIFDPAELAAEYQAFVQLPNAGL